MEQVLTCRVGKALNAGVSRLKFGVSGNTLTEQGKQPKSAVDPLLLLLFSVTHDEKGECAKTVDAIENRMKTTTGDLTRFKKKT